MGSRRKKLTNNSDETDVSTLLSGDNLFSIPYFQRPYKWKPERLRGLENDILKIVDGETDSHFLGAIIIHGRRSNPSDPTIYDVIDGQQRITTLFILICAAIRSLCKLGLRDEAVAIYQKYVALGRNISAVSNIKLHSCKEDRKQLNSILSDLTSDLEFSGKLGTFRPTPLPDTGRASGQLLNNYRSAIRFFDDQVKQVAQLENPQSPAEERIRDIYSAMLENISVVQIDVWDPTDGPRIFNSLNSKQEPMTIGDLVRNEIFSKAAQDQSADIEQIDRSVWQPFYQQFQKTEKNLFDQYFFPYALIGNPNISKSEAFGDLKKRWEKNNNP